MHRSSEAAVVERLKALFPIVADALKTGILISREIHARYNWSPQADRHLAYQLVRRVALEELKPHADVFNEEANLGLPMSGLLLRAESDDVIRIWHSTDGKLPRIESGVLRQFYAQNPYRQDRLFGPSTDTSCSNLALLWDADSTELNRFDLVRPAGSTGPIGHVDWRADLRPLIDPEIGRRSDPGPDQMSDDDPDWE